MIIDSLITDLPITASEECGNLVITDIVEDSRAVTPGCLFVARQGEQSDGRTYISDAVNNGAVAVLTDHEAEVPGHVAALRTDDVARMAAHLAERFFANPSSALTLLGITGTNGKTTVAHLMQQLFTGAGRRCGMIGTVAIHDGKESRPAELTTPSAIETSRLLRRMVDHGCDACVMEVSSHALSQGRTAALDFNVGVFTNLSGDHLDYHGTMEHYAAAKATLFEQLPATGHAVVNHDDAHSPRMMHHCQAAIHRCSCADTSSDCVAVINDSTIHGSDATFTFNGHQHCVHIPLIGRHNVMNALQAVAAAHNAGLGLESLCDALSSCTAPPGRFERVDSADTGITLLVDYAHTDDALDNALSAIRPLVPDDAQLHVVFGCGGDRDRTKRPRMANVACRWADVVWITSDNPRTEDPQSIVDAVIAGVPGDFTGRWHADIDREAAIHAAIRAAASGDVVLIAGKGHEDYQIIGTTKRPFDDRLIAQQAGAALREVCA